MRDTGLEKKTEVKRAEGIRNEGTQRYRDTDTGRETEMETQRDTHIQRKTLRDKQ